MVKLGSDNKPAVVRVQTQSRAEEVLSICNERGWKVIIGIEPDKPENITDIERLLNPQTPIKSEQKIGRNDPCLCGSGKKFKKCCMGKYEMT
jgi:SWIM/SEC-C metal-binding protein